MKARDEREMVEAILAKVERGERLTEREEVVLAYSPYGTGGGCASCAAPNQASRKRTEERDLLDFEELEVSMVLTIAGIS